MLTDLLLISVLSILGGVWLLVLLMGRAQSKDK